MREMIIAPLHPARTGPGVDRGVVVCTGTPSTACLRRPVHRESKAFDTLEHHLEAAMPRAPGSSITQALGFDQSVSCQYS
jgi:hypothetical protein